MNQVQVSPSLCVCLHENISHYVYARSCTISGCACCSFEPEIIRLRGVERLEVENQAATKLREFHDKHRCPKCALGINAKMVFHSRTAWYQIPCKLWNREEHLHLTCDACGAHWDLSPRTEVIALESKNDGK